MSHIDDRFNANQVTVWRQVARNPRGGASYNFLGVFGATWKSGTGVKRDSSGVEFVPKHEYFVDDNADIRRGDLIAQGDRSGSAEPVGDVVRMLDRYDNSAFGWDDSFVVMTE